jgi:trehalose/maltose transport system permease protein
MTLLKRRISPIARLQKAAALLFLAPVLVTLAAVAGWPLARTIFFSFTDATLATIEGARFVGLDNFVYLLRDPVWRQAAQTRSSSRSPRSASRPCWGS